MLHSFNYCIRPELHDVREREREGENIYPKKGENAYEIRQEKFGKFKTLSSVAFSL